MSTKPAAAPVNVSSSLSPSQILADYGLIGSVWLGALLLALVLAPLIGGYPPGVTYGADVSLNALRALICVAALCSSFAFPAGGNVPLHRVLGLALAWATFGFTLLSLLVHSVFLTSPVLLYAMLPATLDWLCYALVFTLAGSLAVRDRRLGLLLAGALLLGAAATAVGVARDYGQQAQQGMRDYRAQGLFFSPNFVGGFLALTLPGLAAVCLSARERIGALVTGVATALAFGALVATGSRAGIGIACLGLLVALVLTLISRPPAGTDAPPLPWVRIVALLAAFAVMAFAFRGPLMAREGAGTGGDEHSGAFRTLTWKGTLVMAKANPILGTGPGTFDVRYPHYAIVEKTDLAHSSYLQLAGEEGFPSLLTAALAVVVSLLAGAVPLLRRQTTDSTTRLLLCGLIGGLLAGALRSLFDSEWSLLGNGIPFWAAAGLVTGLASTLTPSPSLGPAGAYERRYATERGGPKKTGAFALAGAGALGLIFAITLLYGAQTRDGFIAQAKQATAPPSPVSVWPPDPTLLYYQRQPEEAARIEPSGRRLYQLASYYAKVQNDSAKAIDALKKALDADPNSLQTWKMLAETEEAQGDRGAARDAWQELTKHYESPAGQVRAIPELTETYPAFAYAALAKDAAAQGDKAQAAALCEKAAAVIEQYSKTTPLYQQMEIASASMTGADVEGKRQQARDLYEQLMADWAKLQPERAADLTRQKDETLGRLDKFAKPQIAPAG